MATLRETAYYTKKIVKFGSISLLVIIILKLVFDVGKSIWLKYYPPAPPPPTVAFGKLPVLEFSQKQQIGDLEFKLETPTGALPSFLNQARVYAIPDQKSSFLAPEKAKEQAAKLGFIEEPQIISKKIFRWTRKSPLSSILEMDIVSGAFTLSYDWQLEKVILTQQSPPNKNQAIKEAKSFIQKMGEWDNDLVESRIEANYLKTIGPKMIPASSLSEADFTKVEIFRKDIEEAPILTANMEKGIISLILSGVGGAKRIIKAEFNYFPIDYDSSATYPIKSSALAWKELENDQAFIANWKGIEKVTIRRVYLAYYDSWEPQEFLQPIFVFQGDDDFIAYVPAVSEEWFLPIHD